MQHRAPSLPLPVERGSGGRWADWASSQEAETLRLPRFQMRLQSPESRPKRMDNAWMLPFTRENGW